MPETTPAKTEKRVLDAEAKAIVDLVNQTVSEVRTQFDEDVKALGEEVAKLKTAGNPEFQAALDKVGDLEEKLVKLTEGDTAVDPRLADVEVDLKKLKDYFDGKQPSAATGFDPKVEARKVFAEALEGDPVLAEQLELDPRLSLEYFDAMLTYIKGGPEYISGTKHAPVLGRGGDYVKSVVNNPKLDGVGMITDAVMNALSSDFTPGAGIHVPPTVEARILRRAFETSPLLELSGQATTNGPEYIVMVETGNDPAAEERGERQIHTEADDNMELYKEKKIPVHEEIITVPLTLVQIEDSVRNLVDEVEGMLTRRLRKRASWKVHNGTGFADKLPLGLAVDPSVPEVMTGEADSMPFSALTNLTLDLDPDYEANAVILLSKGGLKAAILAPNAIGDRLWKASQRDGTPSLLEGMPWRRDAYLSNETGIEETGARFATGAIPAAVGDWGQACRFVQRLGLTVLRDETSKPGWVKYRWRQRWGWGIVLPEAIRRLKVGV